MDSQKITIAERVKQRRILNGRKRSTLSLPSIKSTSTSFSTSTLNAKSERELNATCSKSDETFIYNLTKSQPPIPKHKHQWQIEIEQKLTMVKFLRDKLVSPDELNINYRLTESENKEIVSQEHKKDVNKKMLTLFE